ncbi:molybdopterin molybdenumtransferase MoeA [Erythrobacter sp. 3-20A1M]|uniref:molybdopterin molybdotransferase MoeA n=1 Tax=Erythrobacter sp. 3-20A1M TaxID=2653850 RepID=UPI001BFC1FD3|nr:molybdopterin molybdotransferase MoeA [Erythrobacter sp. 3-20A1M]QWC58090.1 molybdopterin molybdenumtransferase MoeA [Erythrobacter sp. 3-20A1M]
MNTPPIPLEEAQSRLLELVKPLGTETLGVDDALGRYLAKPLAARRTQPSADLSAMDGYAVAGNGPWRIVGESRCGAPFDGSLTGNQAIRISTGAIMPRSANAVLLQEDATRDGDALSANDRPDARHIRRRGFDFTEGDTLLHAGSRIGAAAIALARSGGHAALEVGMKPRIALLEGGDELARNPSQCTEHQIPASNAAMLRAMASHVPCSVAVEDPIPDRIDALVEAFESHSDADLLVVSGGASVGDHDLVRPALERAGAQIAFWRVAMKPGKPLMVAQRDRQLVLGLPGNPVSSFVTGLHFMLPALRKLAGAAHPVAKPLLLPLAEELAGGGPRREFLRARWDGEALLPLGQQDSSALEALADADALIDRPIDGERVRAGSVVPAYWIGNGAFA